MADSIKQINDVLDMLAEDTSVPRNIRKGATDAKARLMNTKEPMDVRATSAIVIHDDLANDPNIPLHGRTLIWNIISQLEVLSQQKRFFHFYNPCPPRKGRGFPILSDPLRSEDDNLGPSDGKRPLRTFSIPLSPGSSGISPPRARCSPPLDGTARRRSGGRCTLPPRGGRWTTTP